MECFIESTFLPVDFQIGNTAPRTVHQLCTSDCQHSLTLVEQDDGKDAAKMMCAAADGLCAVLPIILILP
jgi:hypothetical protein